jgi:hypothetical protein
MPEAKLTLHLYRLFCHVVEEQGYDDVYLKADGIKIWPVGKKQEPVHEDSITELDLQIMDLKAGQQYVIELWDWDLISADDLYGTFMLPIEEGGPFTTDLVRNLQKTRKAHYTLEWGVY